MSCNEARAARAAERAAMVDQQLRRRGVRDPRVLAAMEDVPRECFVSAELQGAAYGDHALSIGEGQTISQPYMVARACELAQLGAREHALEVGGGSGYQAAILGKLCASVVSIELIESLAVRARDALRGLGIANVEMIAGDGTRGHREHAPYDAIVVAAGAPTVPEALIEQLAPGGRLVIPLGEDALQTLTVFRKSEHGLERRAYDGCVYVPLRGAGGWADRFN